MPSPKNRVVLAAAGSRKTTQLVEEALALPDARILFTTFTNENLDQIRERLVAHHGFVPRNIALLSWYSFLLQDMVRPYQRSLTVGPRIDAINFRDLPDLARYANKSDRDRYYLTKEQRIHRDRVSEFATHANDVSGGAVVRRLENVYDQVFVDEMQDLVGYDLEVLDILFQSATAVTCVGDPRQFTYRTNRGPKNKAFQGAGIIKWLEAKPRCATLALQTRTESYRCNQAICDFADGLFPDMPPTRSANNTETGHDGVFEVPRENVPGYVSEYRPTVLRHSRSSDTLSLPAMNFGASKGRTFDRVLIFPTAPMKKYLETKDPTKAGDRQKFYVAVTRARYSVAFVVG